jgi:hypothetical protein
MQTASPQPPSEPAKVASIDQPISPDSLQELWRFFRRLTPLAAPVFFAIVTLITFGGVLFSADRVVSSAGTDIAMQFLAWREFGFSQLRHGHLALWNPFIYGGTPYLAGFQSALLYPPNWVYLVLPLGPATNWGIALHVWMAGYFVYLWCRHRRVDPSQRVGIVPAMLAGVSFMYCGPYILHSYAGHLPHLCVMVWAALLILTLERLAQGGRWTWGLLGALAAAMMVLAGHPQYVFYTGIILTIYVVILAVRTRFWQRLLVGAAVIVVGAGALSAVQLITGLDAATESLRSGGTNYSFASSFSLPPENLTTMLAPEVLGILPTNDQRDPANPYSGQGYLWELSIFFGITALLMAGLGIVARPKAAISIGIVLIVAMALAMGKNIKPLYDLLYHWFPGYGSFRGTTKFAYLFVLFMCMLASIGLDAVQRGRIGAFSGAIYAGALGLLLLCVAWGAQSAALSPDGMWMRLLLYERATGESYAMPPSGAAPSVARARGVGEGAADSFFTSAVIAMVAAFFLAGAKVGPRARVVCVVLLLILATVEMTVFSRSTLATTSPQIAFPPPWLDDLKARPPNEQNWRVLLTSYEWSDNAMYYGFECTWGYDPNVLGRYGRFVWTAVGYGKYIDQAEQNLPPFDPHFPPHLNMLRMLRVGSICTVINNRRVTGLLRKPLEPAQLIGNVITVGHDAVLQLLESGQLDEHRTVVLEEVPKIVPAGAADSGTVTKCQPLSTDEVEIEADVRAPAILLVTDNFTRGWHVRPLEPAPQQDYQIMPANYTQIAIPLAVGHHHLVLEYLPTAYRVGRAVSIAAVLAFLALCGIGLATWRSDSRPGAQTAAQ